MKKKEEPVRLGKGGKKALIVEDYEPTRRLLRRVLERRGFSIIEAENGLDAVSLARGNKPSLILMDINLPAIDGLNAVRRIRETEALADTVIIIITAYDSTDLRLSASNQGCNGFITKPFDISELESALDAFLPDSSNG